ncbi:hypothetical protein R69927_02369 [Paraburkholderia domus]|jgi:hypothetical protein|uniref:Uncharacterized protein n=1 Tax=Paraburkholderia domus TaxID=2793075 RepID=A0A9N8MWS9_9BURK|nr:hypothetical protein [Paraburkholderia domus]MBK5049451.1 hypothetical protein [Burkholderia sp. R-70006]MBK5061986.1 hypothetical protein [Burkholderia sp. R-70199]MBK5087239.1 hypothetical protein [Burkholderia sp. R-69927]MBK5123593.1 hypothetical protein [Burkholderia sp. R-69980]MBK5166826.1 hypothetical protein [Burkholderia sp. R-70211]MBK5180826.1 hypothetical protein [Burkholderia sp. R-69749]MCI0148236.1 hypothetical protein [Paraburkholderia sediminicola]
MEPTWQFQLRITVSPALANDLRADLASTSHAALRDVLRRHNATLKCQFDAFADYVREAEKQGPENYPLYQWTRQTIENPEKKAKYLQSFTVYVNGDEIYGQEIADVMEAELRTLISNDGIESVARFDTNPANNPQPPRR